MIDRIRSAIILDNSVYLEPGDEQWINMATFCEAYHCLPRPGGYLDQDPVELNVLMAVQGAYAERRAKLSGNQRAGTVPDHPS